MHCSELPGGSSEGGGDGQATLICFSPICSVRVVKAGEEGHLSASCCQNWALPRT